jgi:hypothetical protein
MFFWNCYFLDKTVCRNRKALSTISTVSDNILSLQFLSILVLLQSNHDFSANVMYVLDSWIVAQQSLQPNIQPVKNKRTRKRGDTPCGQNSTVFLYLFQQYCVHVSQTSTESLSHFSMIYVFMQINKSPSCIECFEHRTFISSTHKQTVLWWLLQ